MAEVPLLHRVHDYLTYYAQARGAQQAREVHDVLGEAPGARAQAAACPGGAHSRASFSTTLEAATRCSRK